MSYLTPNYYTTAHDTKFIARVSKPAATFTEAPMVTDLDAWIAEVNSVGHDLAVASKGPVVRRVSHYCENAGRRAWLEQTYEVDGKYCGGLFLESLGEV